MKSQSHYLSLFSSALSAVVIGFASTILIVMQAAEAVGASEAQKISWAAGLCFVMAGLTLLLSWRHKIPMIIAWSTPGAALIASTGAGLTYPLALGAFVTAGVLMVATGMLKPLASSIAKIPTSIAAAMLAGVLVTYVLKVPGAVLADPYVVGAIVAGYFLLRLWQPFYAVPLVLVIGIGAAIMLGKLNLDSQVFRVASLTFDMPQFSIATAISFGVPLYLVTMASQNLPGFAVLRAAGYVPPVRSSLVSSGLASIAMAPFAGPQVNMAAITASLATGPETHPDKGKRWLVAFPYFLLYAAVGLAAGLCVKVLGNLPKDLVTALAGVALFGPLLNALQNMTAEHSDLDAATVTFLVTVSGFTLYGIGAAFWGLIAGLIIWGLKKLK